MNKNIKKLTKSIFGILLGTALTGGLMYTAMADSPSLFAEIMPFDASSTAAPSSTSAPASTQTPTPTSIPPPRTLSVDFMGRGSTPTQTSPPGRVRLTSSDVNKEFWVGVSVDKVDDLNLFTNGVYSVEIAFEYDSAFLAPFTDTTNGVTWNQELIKGNMAQGAQITDSLLWDSDLYDIISVESTDIDTTSDREDIALASGRSTGGWKMCTVCITFKDNATGDKRFKDLTSSDKQYLARIPFILKKVPGPSDLDQDPIVISLVKGPSTLDVGTAPYGAQPYTAWEATVTDPNDQTNMKTLFNATPDLRLFGNATAQLDDIVVSKADLQPSEAPKDYKVSTDKTLAGDGFQVGKTDYYVAVPNSTEKVTLKLNTTDNPTVTFKGNSISVSPGAAANEKVTDIITLDAMDKTIEPDGFNNKIEITVGSTTYNVYIRRYLKPKIELEYGNSPYGEIMAAANIAAADKAAAKAAFDLKNQYDANYLPTAVANKIKVKYTLQAWGKSIDSAVNMDRNDYAIFAYNRQPFKDSGFKAYDAMGDLIADGDTRIQFKREITVDRMNSSLISSITKVTPDTVTINGATSKIALNDITATSKKHIRPDVYTLNYSFTDTYTSETITESRPIVILWALGDVDLSSIVNPSDVTSVYSVIRNAIDFTGVPTSSVNLHKYRMADADMSGIVNPSDVTGMYSIIRGQIDKYMYRIIN